MSEAKLYPWSRLALVSLGTALLCLFSACGGGDDPAPSPQACPAEQSLCGNTCVDLRFDAQHCGACNQSCDAASTCVMGECTERCSAPQIVCDDACVDPRDDREHCGGCGQSCAANESCIEGNCETVCEEGLAACGDSCVDIDSDPSHCGGCGQICWEGETCVDGACTCPEPLERCDGVCTDTSSDRNNCGACGEVCADGLQCVDGSCQCPEGFERCGDRCVDTSTDIDHCGACDAPCGDRPNATASCSQGTCEWSCQGNWEDCDGDPTNGCETDLLSDANNCGTCSNDCSALPNVGAATCNGGSCMVSCEAGWDRCGADPAPGCQTDLSSDDDHCGACGLSCDALPHATHATCEDFACAIGGCEEGWGDCDGDPTNGCEAELAVDDRNCGTCGEVCNGFCSEGVCVTADFVHAASSVSCAKLSNGRVACWGRNSWGQIGTGFPSQDTLRPALVPGLEEIETLSLGEWHACAVDKAGALYCWGDNRHGQIGDGTLEQRNTPVRIQTPHPVANVRAGKNATCATYVNGETWCWGQNAEGQFGDGSTEPTLVPTRMKLDGARQLFLAQQHACGLVGNDLHCFGSQSRGALGNKETSGRSLEPTSPLGLDPGVDTVALGNISHHTCVILQNKHVKCWGQNNYGQLGDGTKQDASFPVLNPSLVNVKQISVGSSHSCAVLEDGSAWCWGYNSSGKLGDGTTEDRLRPTRVVGLENVRQISVGTTYTCATLENGDIYCWGQGLSGRLGNGETTDSHVPARVQWREQP